MKLFVFLALICVTHFVACEEQQVKLEDIEHDTLIRETERNTDGSDSKELSSQQTQHIQLSYSNNPQDIFVTPTPSRFNFKDSPVDLRSHLYQHPKPVHEGAGTYTVEAKKTLTQPIIGGSQPIQPVLTPQPQYIYVQSPHQSHAQQQFIPQANAYFMVPYAMHHQQAYQPQIHMQQHAALPQPTPSIFTYSHGPTSPPHHHHQSYQPVSQLQTSVDYKNVAPLTIVPRKTLPSVTDTNFQQFYSPGLEYHYTESIPTTKLFPHQQVYNYHHHQPAPTASYLQNYVPQMPSYNYYSSAPSAPYVTSYSKPQSTAVLDTYTPSSVTYARPQHQHQQQQYHKNFYQTTPYQQNSHSQLPIPQQLFTPAQQTHYNPQHTPYPSSQAYNTIQYSVPLPPYDHSKRSTSKATANISVNAPKSA